MAGTRTVTIPTEDGRKCVIDFEQQRPYTWTVHISKELLLREPEAIHALLGQALMQMREEVMG